MSTSSVPGVGEIPTADIAVPEHARELEFYSRVLTTGDAPLWRPDLMNSRGAPVIGLGERTPEYEKLPLEWMPHIQVADVAASVARCLEAGGKELWHGKDDDGNSLWAALYDPDGVAFGIIPVTPAQAAEPDAAPTGRICGISLTVPDAAAASSFYRGVIGWSSQPTTRADRVEHDLMAADGTTVATIRDAGGANQDLPQVWMLHLAVADLAASLERVAQLGGEVVATLDAGDGRRASTIIRDPVGVCIALVS